MRGGVELTAEERVAWESNAAFHRRNETSASAEAKVKAGVELTAKERVAREASAALRQTHEAQGAVNKAAYQARRDGKTLDEEQKRIVAYLDEKDGRGKVEAKARGAATKRTRELERIRGVKEDRYEFMCRKHADIVVARLKAEWDEVKRKRS